METLLEGYHSVLAGMEGGELEGVLVGFGSRVVEEEAVVVVAAETAELFCQFLLEGIPDAVGIEAYLVNLFLEGGDVVGMGMAYGNDGMASVEVEVLNALVVPDGAPSGLLGCHVVEVIYIK